MSSVQNTFVKDLANNKIVVTHYCDADLETVWEMWTQPELLELWWAPKPWKAETINMNFKVGGHWLYEMVGPNGEIAYSIIRYASIIPRRMLEAIHALSNAEGGVDTVMPQTDWRIAFTETGDGVDVTVSIVGSDANMQKLVEMRFEQGFMMALENLDEELSITKAKR